jgi:tetratricopeptide (TPR) repeat protein
MASTLRSINTQDMFDVRQQAEFFMTLGRYDEAISLLEQNIAEHSEPNPLVYLDLLKALHTLSRKESFDQYRDVFNGIFTGQVPPYALFNQAGRGLEAYPDLCAHIASVWPSKAALGFIEKSLVRSHDAPAQLGYELEAFRELVLLHGLVTSLSGETNSGAMPLGRIKPESQEMGAHASASIPLAVDLDLSEPVSLSGNLIDFDASGLSSLTPPIKPRG